MGSPQITKTSLTSRCTGADRNVSRAFLSLSRPPRDLDVRRSKLQIPRNKLSDVIVLMNQYAKDILHIEEDFMAVFAVDMNNINKNNYIPIIEIALISKFSGRDCIWVGHWCEFIESSMGVHFKCERPMVILDDKTKIIEHSIIYGV